ncbi:SGNH/GDSL hydrolase family protein [Candidatus Daviesbacteria bacterium]|nr:SGNH/GDSL hydrolase family protein [Candidatus Daviesbacteria bacterium]
MKKLLVILFIIGIYLNRSYSYFYTFLAQIHLPAPSHQTKTIIGTKLDSQIIRYTALGDSLTAGVGVSNYEQSYPYLLSRRLSLTQNVELFNFAQSGATSLDVLTYQIPQALSAKPDLITILIGINDIHNLKSTKEFESNYMKIITALKTTKAKIYLLSIPYLGSEKILFFPYNFILGARTKQFNNIIKNISKNYDTGYIDLNALSKSTGFYSTDQFHPAETGYKEWSETINGN